MGYKVVIRSTDGHDMTGWAKQGFGVRDSNGIDTEIESPDATYRDTFTRLACYLSWLEGQANGYDEINLMRLRGRIASRERLIAARRG